MQAKQPPQDRILDAAMRVFRRHGFRRSSIEQTAEEAGLTRQALYHHFPSKEALFRAISVMTATDQLSQKHYV
jgi:AcrR family transcriptional regulator